MDNNTRLQLIDAMLLKIREAIDLSVRGGALDSTAKVATALASIIAELSKKELEGQIGKG